MRRNEMQDVLIVSASAGTGHVSAGNALRDAFVDAGASAVHVDVLELTPRLVRAAYGGGFGLLASRAPNVWREVYRRSDGDDCDDARWGGVAQRLMFREFRQLLASRRWAACVCTHFLPGQLAAGRGDAPPFVSVLTDFALHRYWVQPRVRHYYVATGDLARDLHRRLPGAMITASGIPIARSFSQVVSRESARAALALPVNRRIVLVMSGGLGIGIEQNTLAALATPVEDLMVVAVCGRNESAREHLETVAVSDNRLRVHGHVTNVAMHVAAADIVVTKPGGLSCSEALATGRPIVLTRAIPGHEDANVDYLVAAGAAVAAPERTDMVDALTRLLNNPAMLAAYTQRARTLGARDAATQIAASVLRRFTRTAAA